MDTQGDIQELFELQRGHYIEIGTRSVSERKADLKKLLNSILKRREQLAEALKVDLGKPYVQSITDDIHPVKDEIKNALKHLEQWSSIRKVSSPLPLTGISGYIKPESKGLTLVIAPFNFPFNLCMGPLVSSIAAGNCCIVKPSEYTPETGKLIQEIIEEVFPPYHVKAVLGASDISVKLTSLPFHHIFFTGGIETGKKVMAAAAKHLTSVTLELGGKSPAIVDSSCKMKQSVERIVWGKFLNSGQVCIAPDYALVEKSSLASFISAANLTIARFYNKPLTSNSLSNIINETHFDRLVSLLEDAKSKGALIETGGVYDRDTLRFAPTILTNVTMDMSVMQEEIFGPILPVMAWENEDDLLDLVYENHRPLAFYVFSERKQWTKELIRKTRAGTTGINECVVQFVHSKLPFGGINQSGIGKAHGKAGFDAFTNLRSVIKKRIKWNPTRLVMPPYSIKTRKIAQMALRWL